MRVFFKTLIIIFSFSSKGAAFEFPRDIPKLEFVYSHTFDELQEYMRKLEREWIVRDLGNDCTIYGGFDNHRNLKACVTRTIAPHYIKETVSYLMRDKIYALFTITKEGAEFKPTPNSKLFSFHYLSSFKEGTLTLDSPDMGVYITLQKSNNEDTAVIRTETENFRLNMKESRRQDSLNRWYSISCNSCGDTPSLRAEVLKDDYSPIHYYLSSSNVEITPYFFKQLSGDIILKPMDQVGQHILKRLKNWGFPKI